MLKRQQQLIIERESETGLVRRSKTIYEWEPPHTVTVDFKSARPSMEQITQQAYDRLVRQQERVNSYQAQNRPDLADKARIILDTLQHTYEMMKATLALQHFNKVNTEQVAVENREMRESMALMRESYKRNYLE